MSWRPEDWDRIKEDISNQADLEWTGNLDSVIEAIADAMLEALKTQPSNRGANVLYVDELADSSTILHNPRRKGELVFIPE